MFQPLAHFWAFVTGSVVIVARGNRAYWAWVALLGLLIAVGVVTYGYQLSEGLIVSNMRDQVSWGFYIGNFTFLVGVAAAAVVLVIPAYVYEWGPIKEVVLIGELMAVAAILMCILFVTVDIGRPERIWHLMPLVGMPNFPNSLLVWDILVLNAYLVVNIFIVTYLMYRSFLQRPYNAGFILPVIFLSIPLAILIHTVTAFLFMGLISRPFWHSALLAPRFLASAFCSGPALLVLIFQVVRRVGTSSVPDRALYKTGELLAYAMAVNLFFLGVEVFKEFYFPTAHAIHGHFQWFGTEGRVDIVVYTWMALAFNVTAFVILVVPPLRHKFVLLNTACVLAAVGVYIEKGMGLLLPGLTPDVLGEVYAYIPSPNELAVGVGIWALGALLFTWMVKIAMEINVGSFRYVYPWMR